MMPKTLPVLLVSAVAALLTSDCAPHRWRIRYPATAGPGDLKLTLSPSLVSVRTREPLLVSLTLHNITDSVQTIHLQYPVYLPELHLVSSDGDTWDYGHLRYMWSMAMDPDAFYRIAPHDSIYWHYLLWPQRFFSRRGREDWPGAGRYSLSCRFFTSRYSRCEESPEPWYLCDTAEVHINDDPDLLARLEPYNALLDSWFRRDWPGNDPDESLLARSGEISENFDSSFVYLEYLLPDICLELQKHRQQALGLAQRFIAKYPNHLLSEEMRGTLALLSTSDFLSAYPRNAAALRHAEGRQTWRWRHLGE
jgi:hypothetical protein